MIEALRAPYRTAAAIERTEILDEFVAVTGYHRKHAIRLLRQNDAALRAEYARCHLYDEAVRQALTVLWEAADRVCGKRPKALIPMQWTKRPHSSLDKHTRNEFYFATLPAIKQVPCMSGELELPAASVVRES